MDHSTFAGNLGVGIRLKSSRIFVILLATYLRCARVRVTVEVRSGAVLNMVGRFTGISWYEQISNYLKLLYSKEYGGEC